MIKLKRAYEPASKDDGLRILVERLWPRGVSKQKAKIDLWLKDLAPSTELRQWYGHDPARWPQFRKRYWAELKGQGDVLALLKYVTEETSRHLRLRRQRRGAEQRRRPQGLSGAG